ncbi:DoxX family protein [Deminuibacter soli]|uniref:DoxX family protein n=1 Tax=Deminuibacter soli TaxID=2291815 RepID=A0A3E1NCS7_9BACT|nr:DoxX family protein [Deminuibacter soli]RFM25662.1 DoxX family protein [Deminuibacter soli]
MYTATVTQSASRKDHVIYWVFTALLVLLDSVPSFWFNSQLAIDGIHHMGFPDYFRIELSIGKIIGGILLIVPAVPARLKEWAYVGFGITFISAAVGHLVLDGIGQALLPLVGFIILIVSYVYFHKTRAAA